MSELVVIQKIELVQLIQDAVAEALVQVQVQKPVKEKMNIKEAAEYLDISWPTLNRKKDEGIIPFSKLGGRVVFAKKDLDEYYKKCSSTATQTATSAKAR